METLAFVLVVLGLVVLGSMLTVAVLARVLYKRIRRSRAVNSAVLQARTLLSYGPRREVLKLRVRLNDTLESGRAAVNLAVNGESARGELPRLFRRIQAEGVTVEAQLRLLATEADPVLLAEGIPAARRRVDLVAGLVRRLRSFVAGSLGEISDDALARLRSDVEREVTALNAGLEELHTLNRNDALLDPYPQPAIARRNMDRLSRGNES